MSDFTLHLGNKNYSSWSLRPWLALKGCGVPFREVVHDIEDPAERAKIRALSPAGRVPFLLDGTLLVWDSLAIIEHAAERFPKAGLWPDDPAARSVARSCCAEMHSGFAALRSHMTMNIRKRYARGPRTPEVQADIDRIVALWTGVRETWGSGGPYLFGRFTAADAFFAPVVTRFRTYDVPLDTASLAYCAAVLETDAMQQWMESAAVETATIPKYEYVE